MIKPARPFGVTVALCLLLAVAFFGISIASNAGADTKQPLEGEKLLSIHVNGETQGVLTSEATIGAALQQAGIPVNDQDLVEPNLDEQLVASHYDVNIYRARPITIIDGSVRVKVTTPYQTPAQIATDAGMRLQDEDTTTLHADVDLKSSTAGLYMTIDRATPFTLVMYGKKVQAYTQATTVDQMLQQKDIALGAHDTLSVDKDTAITTGMTVELWRNGKQTITVNESIKFPIQQIQDTDREVGYKKITTPGEDGKKTVSYEVVMKNGKEVSRKQIQSVTTKKPKKQVEVVGTKITNSFNGDFAGALARLRSCEGSYTSNTGNGYYGAYQYDIGTWGGYKGYPHAAAAPPAVQDERAWQTYQARGWQPWPSCKVSQGLQDIYR